MEGIFNDILDDGEIINRIFKPNKFMYYLKNILTFTMFYLFIIAYCISVNNIIGYIVCGVLLLLLIGFTIIETKITYDNLFYCYTDKRLIVRHGFIGVDFKSLDISTIGALNVKVSLFDKLFRKNTGTITFFNPSSQNLFFTFGSVVKPYETYKELKSQINVTKYGKLEDKNQVDKEIVENKEKEE